MNEFIIFSAAAVVAISLGFGSGAIRDGGFPKAGFTITLAALMALGVLVVYALAAIS